MKVKHKIVKIHPTQPQPEIIEKAARVIKNGGVIAFPTRCLYGIAADAFNISAVEKVFKIKNRPLNKALLVLIKNCDAVNTLAKHIPTSAQKMMDRFWPGEVTIVFEAQPTVPATLTAGSEKIGIRLPEHPVAMALLNALDNPITGTSANLSQGSSCHQVSDLNPKVMDNLDLILDSGPLKGGSGSTVVDVTNIDPVVLREGEIPKNDIFNIL